MDGKANYSIFLISKASSSFAPLCPKCSTSTYTFLWWVVYWNTVFHKARQIVVHISKSNIPNLNKVEHYKLRRPKKIRKVLRKNIAFYSSIKFINLLINISFGLFVQLNTVLIRIEGILNSRPLLFFFQIPLMTWHLFSCILYTFLLKNQYIVTAVGT